MMYGAKYIERYKAMLTKIFARGSKKSSSKMGPGMMREQLVQLFPGVFQLPNVSEIQQFITQLFAKEKRLLKRKVLRLTKVSLLLMAATKS
jgi:hypothetical protein